MMNVTNLRETARPMLSPRYDAMREQAIDDTLATSSPMTTADLRRLVAWMID
ncbi:hypothetical protein GRI62_12300 [Erythrobacter arachoides]|uniref:Uncharacterized protein n=1 Tax=Aurantiacibacter arachoides TaxID=1850444 RepID=A0A845A371_9SPHN|nr:hypothetical protein [Aurantiacibacter arachoides]MXO94378.1 hypothetical protein [Aurantiacibacter arachoides]